MTTVIFYTKENCSLCDDAISLLLMFQREYDFTVEERDIYTNDEWLEKYQIRIPVVDINGDQLDCEQMGYDALKNFLKENMKNEKST